MHYYYYNFISQSLFKPKFLYADFATFTETSPQGKLQTQIMKDHDTNHVANFHDLCPWQSPRMLLPTFPVHCNGLNSMRVTQMGLSQTCHRLCRWHLNRFVSATFTETSWFHDLSPFASATLMPCVHDFPRMEVSVKVGVMEFGLNSVTALRQRNVPKSTTPPQKIRSQIYETS